MSKKSKRVKERKPYPDWWKDVDRDMRLYLTWGRAIKQQENLIETHRLTGMRTTPVYELREGSFGGDNIFQAEKILIDIDIAEKKIAAGKMYRANIEETVRFAAAGDPDKETFIKRYWLTTANLTVRGRIDLVLEALPFLAHREWETGQITSANRNFYVWRENLYESLAELLGYGESIYSEEEEGVNLK